MSHSQMLRSRRKKQATRKRLAKEAKRAKKLRKQMPKTGAMNVPQPTGSV